LILTDREIQIGIERGLITIDPRPNDRTFSSTSVDLTLDATLTEFKSVKAGIETVIDPDHDKFSSETVLAELTNSFQIPADGYLLRPGPLFLGGLRKPST